jgi:hypothetical protein
MNFFNNINIKLQSINDCKEPAMEIQDVMSQIIGHSLEIGRLLKFINKKEHMSIEVATNPTGWTSAPIEICINDDTIHHIISSTNSRSRNFCEVNCALQKYFDIEYEHRVYHTYKITK